MKFTKYDTFVFDVDGTLWNSKNLFPGVTGTIKLLREAKRQVLFVTNRTLTGRAQILKRLQHLGLTIRDDELVTSSEGAAEFLKGKKGNIMIFGDGVKKDFRKWGIKYINSLPVKYVVLSHDPSLNYKKLGLIYKAYTQGATIIATAVGRLFSYSNEMLPGMGSIIAAIEFMTQKKVTFVGKPSEYVAKLVKAKVRGKKVIMFGDEANSDIPFAKSLGWTSVLVQTGVDKKSWTKYKPDYVLKSVADIEI